MIITALTESTVFVVNPNDGHSGEIPIISIEWSVNSLTGIPDKSGFTIQCPGEGCTSSASFPVSGGAAPDEIQRLAIVRAALDETGTKKQRVEKAKAAIRKMITDRDPSRWRAEIDDEDESTITKIKERREQRQRDQQVFIDKWDREAPAREKAAKKAREDELKARLQEQIDAKAAMQVRIDTQAKERAARDAIRKQEREDAEKIRLAEVEAARVAKLAADEANQAASNPAYYALRSDHVL